MFRPIADMRLAAVAGARAPGVKRLSIVSSAEVGPVLSRRLAKLALYLTSTGSMVVGLAAQSIALIVVARYLGKAQYGQLTALTAFASLCSSWVQFGTAELIRRRIAQNRAQFPAILGHSLVMLFGVGSIVTLLISAGTAGFVHIAENRLENVLVIWMVAACTLQLFPWMVCVEQVFLAHSMFSRANLTNSGFGVWRALVAATACIGFGVDTIQGWALWNFAAYAVASVVGLAVVLRLGLPVFGLLREELTTGATFGVSGFLYNVRTNVDVLALSSVASAELVGVYGMARKLVAIAIVTSASLDRLIYSSLVRAAQGGRRKATLAAFKFGGYATIIGATTAVAVYVAAPFLVRWCFGPTFADAAPLAQALCGLVLILALQNLAFDSLNSSNMHKLQIGLSSACALVGAPILFVLTRKYEITGAIAGVYLMEASLAIALWAGLTAWIYPGLFSRTLAKIRSGAPTPGN